MDMRAHTKLPLDDDLIYRVFTFLPDFNSLQAFLAVSKAFHQVYLTYPESIVRAIAYNVAGPALPHALRLIKFQLSEDRGDDTYPPDELVNVEHITPLEARQIPRIAETIHEFETRFSRLHKNRCVSTSTLTPPESLRFQRALYRIWLFTAHFTPRFCDLDEGDEDEIADIKRTCVKFMSDLGDREVFEMHSVTLFLEELSQGVVNSDSASSSFVKYGLMVGPEVLLQCLHEWSIFPIEGESEIPIEEIPEELRDDYLVYPITRTLEKRQLKVPTDSVVIWKNILDEVVGENDQCELCHKTEGLKLWSEHNWDLLRSVHSPGSMANLLKGRLRATPNGHTLCNYLQDRTLCFSAVLGVIFDELRRPQYEALEKQHGLCIQCLDTFLSDHLHLWLLDRRRKAGNTDLEDCWYGYNCRTQTHRLAHATKLNGCNISKVIGFGKVEMERDQRLPPQPQVDEEDASLIHFTFQLLNMLRIILLISLGSLVYIGAKASPVLKTSPHPFSAKSDRTWLWGWAWGAESTVSVVDRSPVVSWPSRPAAFGAELADPLLGYVIPLSSFTEPCGDSESQKLDGEGSNWGCPKLCVKGPHQPEPTETWIALVQRGECEFVSKIREAQRLGAKAVVVGGSDPDISGWPDTLVNMYSTEDASDVKIASTFIKFAAYKELTSLISTSNTSHSGLRTLSLLITAEYSAWEWYSPVITFVIILLLPSVLTFITLLIHRVRAARAAQLDRAPENIVRHLPWRIWTGTGWEKHEGSEDASASPDTHGPESAATSPNVEPVPNMSNEEAEAAVEASTSTPLQVEQPWFEQQTECAICLSQFEKGDKVRVLPCHHIFHLDEVDEWLIQRKKLCPVCKADVTQPHPVLPTTTPTSASTPTPSNSTDHDPPTERTPLLSNQS